MPLGMYFVFLGEELGRLRRLADCTDAFLGEEAAHLSRTFPEDEDLAAYHNIEFGWFNEDFPCMLHGALLITAFAVFEQFLSHLCTQIRERNGYQLGREDLARGNGEIERSLVYMKKVANVEIPDLSANWRRLLELRALRNKVVHAGGHRLLATFDRGNGGTTLREAVTEIGRLAKALKSPLAAANPRAYRGEA
jgi:hypothetical protein